MRFPEPADRFPEGGPGKCGECADVESAGGERGDAGDGAGSRLEGSERLAAPGPTSASPAAVGVSPLPTQ